MLEGHGDDLHRYEGEIKYNFSSNVYNKGCSTVLLEALQEELKGIQNYPSPSANELNILAAQHFNLNQNQFLFTNGATEAFYLIGQKYRGETATIFGPTFSEYEDACRVHGVDYIVKDQSLLAEKEINNSLVFICNPNNPDGKLLSLTEITELLQTNLDTRFIIDEAYTEFSNIAESAVSLIRQFDNLVIVRSLTKTFAIPGLRLGYLIAQSDFIDELSKLKMPWSVNSLAIAAGRYIFEHYQELSFDPQYLIEDADAFKSEIAKIEWLEVVTSTTSYFLARLLRNRAKALKTYLVEEHGILIRDATNFTGLEGEHIRLSVQSDEANQALLKALLTWR